MHHLVDKFACRAATGILETSTTTACSKRHGRRRAAASTTSRLSCPALEPAAAHRLAGMPTKRLIGRRPEVEPMSGNEPTRIEFTQQRKDTLQDRSFSDRAIQQLVKSGLLIAGHSDHLSLQDRNLLIVSPNGDATYQAMYCK
jgi:hypothetical protein